MRRALQTSETDRDFLKNCSLTRSERKQIEHSTRAQDKTPSWKMERLYRITASVAHDFGVQAKKGEDGVFTDRLLEIIEGRSNFSNEAIIYGKSHENAAKEAFLRVESKAHTNMRLLDIGLVIHKDLPFLAASPDALCVCDCHPSALLEVKAPLRLKDASLDDVKLEYLIKVPTGKLRLRPTHR